MASKKSLKIADGIKIPTIGLGTWQAEDESQLEAALNAAFEAGYRHFDTAYFYANEAVIGRVLNQWISSGKAKREDLFVTTKLPISGVHEDRVEMFLEKSLKNLQLEYVDLYLIHFPIGTNYVEGFAFAPADQMRIEAPNHAGVWKKMEEQVDSGRTRAIGLSNFNKRQVESILKSSRIKPACLQIEIHVNLQQHDLVHYCQQNGIVVVGYSPLGSPGFNKYMKAIGAQEKQLPNLLHDSAVESIAEKHRKTCSQVLLRFLVQQDIVAIPKSVSAVRIKENIDIYDFVLDADDMETLKGLEVGEAARILDFRSFEGFEQHPEWPFGDASESQ